MANVPVFDVVEEVAMVDFVDQVLEVHSKVLPSFTHTM